ASEKIEIERKIGDLDTQASNLANLIREDEKNFEQLILENIAVHSKYESAIIESEEWRRRLSLVGLTINRVYYLMEDMAGASIRLKLGQLNEKRAQIMRANEVDDLELRDMLRSLEILKSEVAIGLERIKTLNENGRELEDERKEKLEQEHDLKSN